MSTIEFELLRGDSVDTTGALCQDRRFTTLRDITILGRIGSSDVSDALGAERAGVVCLWGGGTAPLPVRGSTWTETYPDSRVKADET
jgi:hypothetical protein